MKQHNEKRATAVSEMSGGKEDLKKNDDNSYEVTIDDDFLTALEYGMPPASGMVCLHLNLYLIVSDCLTTIARPPSLKFICFKIVLFKHCLLSEMI